MYVDIDFDKSRRLRFDLSAIQDLEAQMGGQPLGAIVHQLTQMGITALRNALWAGLKHEDRALTPNLVTKKLTRYIEEGKNLKTLYDRVSDAIEASGLFKGAEADGPEGNVPTPEAAVQT
jgi:hypothetical protein